MTRRMWLGVALAALAGLAAGPYVHAAGNQYTFVKEIHIGGEGGWDYLNVDPDGKRLYVSHANKVVVVDTAADKIAGEIPDTPGVHGIALAPKLGRGFISAGRGNQGIIFDLKTLQVIKKVDTGRNPDAILYEPKQNEVYTFNGQGKSATVFKADSGDVVATIDLGGKPEFAAADPGAGRVYVNMEDLNNIAVIDAASHKVVANWPIAPGESASGMAIDTAHHRLFIGCHNNLMLMIDTTTGKVAGQVPIGNGVDATWFDPGTGLAFSSCGDGTTTVAHEDAPGKLTVVQTLQTERSARTMALDPKTHRIYLASAKFGEAAAGQRPQALPDSMRILVYEMK